MYQIFFQAPLTVLTLFLTPASPKTPAFLALTPAEVPCNEDPRFGIFGPLATASSSVIAVGFVFSGDTVNPKDPVEAKESLACRIDAGPDVKGLVREWLPLDGASPAVKLPIAALKRSSPRFKRPSFRSWIRLLDCLGRGLTLTGVVGSELSDGESDGSRSAGILRRLDAFEAFGISETWNEDLERRDLVTLPSATRELSVMSDAERLSARSSLDCFCAANSISDMGCTAGSDPDETFETCLPTLPSIDRGSAVRRRFCREVSTSESESESS
jgi:hypothetical protein